MDYLAIIDQYYPQGSKVRDILLTHSECVTRKALQIVDKHPELKLDRTFIQEAAMLHDIGIVKCDAFANATRVPESPCRTSLNSTYPYPIKTFCPRPWRNR